MKLETMVQRILDGETESIKYLGLALVRHALNENDKNLREVLISIEQILSTREDQQDFHTGMLKGFRILGSVLDRNRARKDESFGEPISDASSMDALELKARDIVQYFDWNLDKEEEPRVNYRYRETWDEMIKLGYEIREKHGKNASLHEIFHYTQEIPEGSHRGTAARLLFYAANNFLRGM